MIILDIKKYQLFFAIYFFSFAKKTKFATPNFKDNKKLRKVTKADVINEISEKTGVERKDVQASVEAFFSVVKDNMESGNNIYVRGFGSFVNKKRAKKIARNISKNTSIVIDEHFVPSFKPSKSFVERVKAKVK